MNAKKAPAKKSVPAADAPYYVLRFDDGQYFTGFDTSGGVWQGKRIGDALAHGSVGAASARGRTITDRGWETTTLWRVTRDRAGRRQVKQVQIIAKKEVLVPTSNGRKKVAA